MKWKKKSMETSDRVVKGKPTAGTNGEVEKPALSIQTEENLWF